MTTTSRKGFAAFISDCMRWALTGGIGYKIYLAALFALIGAAIYSYSQQFQ